MLAWPASGAGLLDPTVGPDRSSRRAAALQHRRHWAHRGRCPSGRPRPRGPRADGSDGSTHLRDQGRPDQTDGDQEAIGQRARWTAPGRVQGRGAMSRVRRSFVVATSEFLLVGMAAVVSATPGTGGSGTILAKGTSPNGIVVSSREKTDVAVLEITIAPGGSTGWHYHDGQVIAVVKSGTLT